MFNESNFWKPYVQREISYAEFVANNDEYYYAAQFEPFELENQVYNFEVGDGRNYSDYYNPPLDQNQDYTIWFQALSIEPNCVKSCDLAANCHVVAASEISDLEVVTELPSFGDRYVFYILIILVENNNSICSWDFKLFFDIIFSIQIINIFRVNLKSLFAVPILHHQQKIQLWLLVIRSLLYFMVELQLFYYLFSLSLSALSSV